MEHAETGCSAWEDSWGSALTDHPTQNVKWRGSWAKLSCQQPVLWGESFWATAELFMHAFHWLQQPMVSAPQGCLSQGKLGVWECLHRGYFSLSWQIINEFVSELASWSWHNAGRCLCFNPFHPSLLDLPDSPSLSFFLYIEGSWECTCRKTLLG